MATILRHARFVAGALALACIVRDRGAGCRAAADSVNPTANAVNEQKLLERAQPDHRAAARCPIRRPARSSSPPAATGGSSIRSRCRWIGAIAILGMLRCWCCST